jgi:hypothetical protein
VTFLFTTSPPASAGFAQTPISAVFAASYSAARSQYLRTVAASSQCTSENENKRHCLDHVVAICFKKPPTPRLSGANVCVCELSRNGGAMWILKYKNVWLRRTEMKKVAPGESWENIVTARIKLVLRY